MENWIVLIIAFVSIKEPYNIKDVVQKGASSTARASNKFEIRTFFVWILTEQ